MSNETDIRAVEKNYSQRAIDANYRMQKFVALYGILPIVIYSFIRYFFQPVWQNVVFAASVVVAFGVILFGVRVCKRGRLRLSMMVDGTAILLFETVAMIVQEDIYLAGFSGCITVVVYAASFSSKHLYIFAVGTVLSIALALTIHATQLIEPFALSTPHYLLYMFLLAGFPFVAVVAALKRNQSFLRKLVASVKALNKEQQGIIEAAGEKTGQLEESMKRVRTESKVVADRIYEQVTSVGQIVEAMGQINDLSRDTASASSHAAGMAAGVSESSRDGKNRLEDLEQRFVEVVMANDVVRFEFADLADKAENIGDIMVSNREIISQIKILAINAGIQAAKAGEFGLGFAVVARELKGMIQRTEESLNNVTQLLEYIRTQARQSSSRIEENSENMHRQLAEINSTGKLFDQITEAFENMSGAVNSISQSNNTQQGMLQDLGFGVSNVDMAAEQLLNATVALVDNVAEITSSHDALLDLLKSEQESLEKQKTE